MGGDCSNWGCRVKIQESSFPTILGLLILASAGGNSFVFLVMPPFPNVPLILCPWACALRLGSYSQDEYIF